jgi:hypothetical protein
MEPAAISVEGSPSLQQLCSTRFPKQLVTLNFRQFVLATAASAIMRGEPARPYSAELPDVLLATTGETTPFVMERGLK